jgi:hypothetical protein
MPVSDYIIIHDPKPIPSRNHDWEWQHKDYDGPGDKRCGTTHSREAAVNAIIEFELDESEPWCDLTDEEQTLCIAAAKVVANDVAFWRARLPPTAAFTLFGEDVRQPVLYRASRTGSDLHYIAISEPNILPLSAVLEKLEAASDGREFREVKRIGCIRWIT